MKHSDDLTGEYLNVYIQSERYVKLHINYKETINGNDCLIEIKDLLMIAQDSQTPTEEVVGNDINLFVRNVYKAYYPFSVVNYVYSIHMLSLLIALAIAFVFSFIEPDNLEYAYSNVYVISVISFLLADLIKRGFIYIADHVDSVFGFITKRVISGLLNSLNIIIFVILTDFTIIDLEVRTLTVLLILLFSAIPGIVYLVKTENIHFKKDNQKTFKETLFKTLDKQFDKKNKKLKSKGMMPLTNNAWSMVLKKRYAWYDVLTGLVLVLYLGLISGIIFIQVEDGFTFGGIAALIILSLVILFLGSYYHSKKYVKIYIKERSLGRGEENGD